MKHNRWISFGMILIIYILAAKAGMMLRDALPYAWWLNLLLADVGATVLVFLFSAALGNASVYDPYWSVAPVAVMVDYALRVPLTGLNILHLAAICFWGLRLTANWAYTFQSLDFQDWRYTMLREKTGRLYPLVNLGGIHLMPTLIVYGCMLPAVYAAEKGLEGSLLSAAFVALSLGAACMQGIADWQMQRYRRNRPAPFIREGLWHYSRHPNYLGEILMWWGIALSVVCVTRQYWLCAGAAANTALFLLASIPMADRRQAQKPGFEEYKRETRMLLPIKK